MKSRLLVGGFFLIKQSPYLFVKRLRDLSLRRLLLLPPLKNAIAILLFLTLAVQCFHKAFVVMNFYLNQAEIAATLCENKEKPQLKCGGKCQLMKELAKEEKKEQQLPHLKWDGKEQVLSSRSFFCTGEGGLMATLFDFTSLADKKPVQQPRAFFHPPGC